MSLAPWIALVVVLGITGMLAIVRRPKRGSAQRPSEPTVAATETDDRMVQRSYALDALGEGVLILDRDGRVKDCNSSALTLFDRHRAGMEGQFAVTLRRFEGLDQSDPHRVASEHAVWAGEAWARQPDGGVKLCLSRVIAVRDGRARVTGYVESFRDVTAERAVSEEFRDLLYGVRAFDSISSTPQESVRAVQDELRVLSEAFRDLDLVVRQYERLLPALRADDPLTESIAGLAHEARAVVASVGVPALLEEIPRALARLRSHMQRVALDATTPDAEPTQLDGGVREED